MIKTTKHPEGVWTIFSLAMFSMVGFSMLFVLLTLYCTHVLHFAEQRAYDISDAFNAQVFAFSVLGGYLGNKFLGYRYAFILSSILMIGGLALVITTNITAFYLGLGMYTLGNGIMLPALYVLLSMLYEQNDPRRDAGFILAYVGLNVGAFSASLLSGPISMKIGYHAAFFVGLIFTIFMLINFLLHQYKFKPVKIDTLTKQHSESISKTKKIIGTLIALATVPFIAELLNHANWNNFILTLLGIFAISMTIYFARQYDDINIRRKIYIFLLLCILSLFFWSLYLLVPTVIPLFTERNVDRYVFGYLIPTASFSSLNPFFIITVGPLLSILWMKLQKKNIVVSTPKKFGIGIFLMGLGFLTLALAIEHHNPLGLILAGWLVLSYFFQTVGELFVSPIGYAMVGALVPFELEGTMQGVWQLFTGVGGVYTDYLANMTHRTVSETVTNPLLTNPDFSYTFLFCGGITALAGILTWIFSPMMQKYINK